MAQVTRVYKTPAQAKRAVSRLRQAGFRDAHIALIGAPPDADIQTVAAALAQHGIGQAFIDAAAPLIAAGAGAVTVAAPFGWAARAEQVLTDAEPVPIDAPDMDPPPAVAPLAQLTALAPRAGFAWPGPMVRVATAKAEAGAVEQEPAPLSRWLGWPVLLRGAGEGGDRPADQPAPLSAKFGWSVLSSRAPKADLLPERWFLSDRLGFGLLSNEPAPLSKATGRAVLSDDAAPLSKRFGWDTLNPEAAPLSAKAGWKTLLDDPSPLSRLLGLSVLAQTASPPVPVVPHPVAHLAPPEAPPAVHAPGSAASAKPKRTRSAGPAKPRTRKPAAGQSPDA